MKSNGEYIEEDGMYLDKDKKKGDEPGADKDNFERADMSLTEERNEWKGKLLIETLISETLHPKY